MPTQLGPRDPNSYPPHTIFLVPKFCAFFVAYLSLVRAPYRILPSLRTELTLSALGGHHEAFFASQTAGQVWPVRLWGGIFFFSLCCFLPYFIAICWKGSRFSKFCSLFQWPMNWRMLLWNHVCNSSSLHGGGRNDSTWSFFYCCFSSRGLAARALGPWHGIR